MIEKAGNEVQHERIPKRRQRRIPRKGFFTVNREVKQADKYGKQ